jgi:hypothetical protein
MTFTEKILILPIILGAQLFFYLLAFMPKSGFRYSALAFLFLLILTCITLKPPLILLAKIFDTKDKKDITPAMVMCLYYGILIILTTTAVQYCHQLFSHSEFEASILTPIETHRYSTIKSCKIGFESKRNGQWFCVKDEKYFNSLLENVNFKYEAKITYQKSIFGKQVQHISIQNTDIDFSE